MTPGPQAFISLEGSLGPKPEYVVWTLLPVPLTNTVTAIMVNQDCGKEITTSQLLIIKGCNQKAFTIPSTSNLSLWSLFPRSVLNTSYIELAHLFFCLLYISLFLVTQSWISSHLWLISLCPLHPSSHECVRSSLLSFPLLPEVGFLTWHLYCNNTLTSGLLPSSVSNPNCHIRSCPHKWYSYRSSAALAEQSLCCQADLI